MVITTPECRNEAHIVNPVIDMLATGGRRRTPYVAQSEGSECALACLAMVAGFHGYDTDMTALRQRFNMSLKGATLKQVIQIAEDIGFNARPLRGEIDDLPHLSLPAVLHWNLNHFVVLTKIGFGIGQKRYFIHDPARGEMVYNREEISKYFTGVALDLIKSESFRPKIDKRQLGITQLWSSMSGFWQTIWQVILLSIVLQVIVIASPFFLQISIDTVFPSFDRDLLTVLAIGFGGLTVISFLTIWLRSLVLLTLGNSLSYQVVVNLFRHLVRLPLEWFEKRHVGDIISRFGSTQPISQLLSQGMIAAFIDGVMALITLSLMFLYSGLLGTIAVIALLIYTAIRILFLHTLRLRNLDVINAIARENSSFIETVRGIAAIKAFGQEGSRQRLWQKTKVEAVNAQIKLGRLSAGFDAVGQLVLALEKVVFIFIAVRLALDSKLSIGMIFAFQAYKDQFLGAGMRLVEQSINFRLINMHLSRISDIALSRREDEGRRLSHDKPDFSLGIDVCNVHYRYGANEADILKGINLKIEPGEMTALIGPSGGGKTTLMKILMGLFEARYGDVLIGDRSIKSFGKQAYRQCIGSVAQDDSLYAGSLAENISFFDSEIDMRRVEEVSKLAAIHDEIDKMPLRYDTLIGDMGSVLSGGQKQRLLLARALYSRPQILFMDEGTAHLDPENEKKILVALSQLKITRILVAHRTQSVNAAKHVYAIVDGKIQYQNNLSN